MLTQHFGGDVDNMMAPLMEQDEWSYVNVCVSPMPNSVVLGSQCGTTQMNSITETLKSRNTFFWV